MLFVEDGMLVRKSEGLFPRDDSSVLLGLPEWKAAHWP